MKTLLMLVVGRTLVRTGLAWFIVGLVGALITSVLGSKGLEIPMSRNPVGRGRWKGARMMRLPFAIAGIVGLTLMIVASL
jgi:hypothetical protein